MRKIIERIKQFFNNLATRNKIKQIDSPKESQVKDYTIIASNKEEKDRILELYKKVNNHEIDFSKINKEDLLKIRRLLLEEAKIQDEKLKQAISILEKSID